MNSINIPQIKIPQGGGTLRGADENFSANAFTGTANLNIPVPIPDSRGVSPHISIGYSSTGGNGLLGMGFHLSESSISIKTNRALPKYDPSDIFEWDGQELVLANVNKPNVYLERHQNSFALIEKIGEKDTVYWKITGNDNTITFYGNTEDARVFNPKKKTHIAKWLISEQIDAHGNKVKYNYNKFGGTNTYLTSVEYGNYTLDNKEYFAFKVIIDYGQVDFQKNKAVFTFDKNTKTPSTRPDVISNYRMGFLEETTYLVRNVLVQHNFVNNKATNLYTHCTAFEYKRGDYSRISYLTKITSFGLKRTEKENEYTYKETPSIELGFSRFSYIKNKPLVFKPIIDADKNVINQPLNFVDFNKEGMAGILYRNADTLFYSRPLGNGQFGKETQVSSALDTDTLNLPNQFANPRIPLNLVSLEGNGQLQIELEYAQNSGYFPLKDNNKWDTFVTFPNEQINNIPYRTEHVDVSGGNRADQLIITPNKVFFRASHGFKGMSEQLVEVPNDNQVEVENQNHINPYVYYGFADFFGDGLSHRIKIENNKLSVWPSLGYGKFGAKKSVDIPEFDIENQNIDLRKRLVLADVNGSGTSDIVVLFPDHFKVYFNQNGSGFSKPIKYDLPDDIQYSEFDHVQFHDVVGNGNTCLVFSKLSPHVFKGKYYDIAHYYCELNPSREKGLKQSPCNKAFLLRSIKNNMGLESTLTYKSSLRDYLDFKKRNPETKKAENAWQTRLPFPTIVLNNSSVYDAISQSTFTHAYKYRNGYYDPNEHSFVGFGNVWQYDILDASKEVKDLQNTLHKTWFHLGLGQKDVQNEYFKDATIPQIPREVFDVKNEVLKKYMPECLFALVGNSLHSEVYQTDYTGYTITNPCPYSVESSCYTLMMTQEPTDTSKGVFKLYANESLSINYEQQADDPHVSHHAVIKIDPYLQVLRDASVVYPRIKPLIDEQGVLHIAASEHKIYNQDKSENRYIGIGLEGRSFEICNTKKLEKGYFSYDRIKEIIGDAFENVIPYSGDSDTKIYARLLSWERSKYWDTEQKGIWEENEPLNIILPHHSESIVFDKKNLADILEKRVNEAQITEGGYVFAEGYYWARTPIAHYANKENFYLLEKVSYDWAKKDSYLYTESTVKYDDYWFFPLSSATRLNDKDSIVTSAEIDYRTLSPWRVTDANGNKAEVLTDELGMVIATAAYEKDGTTNGDVPLSMYEIKPIKKVDDIFDNPVDYIQGASSFFYYKFPEKQGEQWLPALAASLSRTVYKTKNKDDIQRAIAYSDGLGRVIESKKYAGTVKVKTIKSEATKENQWLASGRVTYNAKGEVTESYLSFTSDTWAYMESDEWIKEVKPNLPPPTTFLYDATGRNYQVNTPKGLFSRTLILNAWESQHFDESDTILESDYYKNYLADPTKFSPEETDALKKSVAFYNTPQTPIVDNLGRQILAVSNNALNNKTPIDWEKKNKHRLEKADIDATNPNLLIQWQSFDIQGRTMRQADARLYENNQKEGGKKYNFEHFYPIAGGIARSWSADAGEGCSFADAQGNALISWDAMGNVHEITYDNLHRPLSHTITKPDGSKNILTATVYAESQLEAGKTFTDLQKENSVGKAIAVFDNAGLVETKKFTFDGHALIGTRQFRKDYITDANWTDAAKKDAAQLEKDLFTTTATFDAAGRPLTQIMPDGSLTEWKYGTMGNCTESAITVNGQTKQVIVNDSLLNQYGQLVQVKLGNGVKTTHIYDALTQGIKQIKSVVNGKALQDQSYWHDATGLITTMQNNLAAAAYFKNQLINPVNTYTYDALYRLKTATGRIQLSRAQTPLSKDMRDKLGHINIHQSADLQALSTFTENYEYDKGNNLIELQRTVDKGTGFKRSFTIGEGNNRVSEYRQGDKTTKIEYSDAGQMQNINGNSAQKITWNTLGNIATVTLVDRKDTAKNDTEYYIYDAAGIRVRKVTVRRKEDGTIISTDDKRYIGNYRCTKTNAATSETRHNLTIGGVQKHDCVVQYSTNAQNTLTTEGVIYRYQHANHLNSVGMETNQQGDIISYEEYSAFGDTVLSYALSNLDSTKEYRYSAQEKDDTTGLYYYGYRYYAPWLCRWTKPDPAGTIDGFNLYAFVGNEPIGRVDVMGLGIFCCKKKEMKKKAEKEEIARGKEKAQPAAQPEADLYDPKKEENGEKQKRKRVRTKKGNTANEGNKLPSQKQNQSAAQLNEEEKELFKAENYAEIYEEQAKIDAENRKKEEEEAKKYALIKAIQDEKTGVNDAKRLMEKYFEVREVKDIKFKEELFKDIETGIITIYDTGKFGLKFKGFHSDRVGKEIFEFYFHQKNDNVEYTLNFDLDTLRILHIKDKSYYNPISQKFEEGHTNEVTHIKVDSDSKRIFYDGFTSENGKLQWRYPRYKEDGITLDGHYPYLTAYKNRK